ncbi:MAG: hypothetical protein WKF82_00650 [Nocardioidaceae bacterium]
MKPVADRVGPRTTWTRFREKTTQEHGIHLLGWTGDYNDTDNFLGVFFGRMTPEWGFDNPETLRRAVGGSPAADGGRAEAGISRTPTRRSWTICLVSRSLTRCHRWPSRESVKGYYPSPVQDEVFSTVVVTE